MITSKKAAIEVETVMFTIFFSGMSLITLNARHLMRDSIKNILSITPYLKVLKEEGEFSIDFAGATFCAHCQFHMSQWSQGDRSI
jgi:hypothetical protein